MGNKSAFAIVPEFRRVAADASPADESGEISP